MGKKGRLAKDKGRTKRVNTRKIINKMIHPQTRGKRGFRAELKKNSKVVEPLPTDERENLKFGSINIDGIDVQKHSAVQQLISSRGFDVGRSIYLK